MLETGTYLADRYEIIRNIGAGGMSDVYQAKDQVLGRFVAIKVLKSEFTEDMNFVTKFHAEAQAAAGLEHPNIVNIYDVGSENSMHYIVMEYIDGITLKEYIEKKGQISEKETISIAIQVGRGIEAAHKKNIIHRDIKPQNIMISKQGKVKVTDFGIAKAVNANTIHSDVMGSVHYSSPEQARNGFVDVKSDIYSLGIVMYEMVTGRVPFDGDTTVAIAIQHIQEEIETPRTYAPDIPISLEKIILKCTQKSPDRRYPQMSELLADLKRALQEPDVDFVVMATSASDKTRVIGTEELKQIKEQTAERSAEAPSDAAQSSRQQNAPAQETEDPEDETDADIEEASGFLNPKMEKIVTILGIIAAVIILLIVLYFVMSIAGAFRGVSSLRGSDQTEDVSNDLEDAQPEDGEAEADAETETEKTMIRIVGMTYEEAFEALQDIGLSINENGNRSSEEYAEGIIIEQSIAEGAAVETGMTVDVITSSGKGSVAVPDVVGYTDNAAIGMLQDAGFAYIREYENSLTVPEGTVISQSPEGSTDANPGDTITIVVSQGMATVTVPDLKAKTAEEAEALLEESGLVGVVTEEYSATVEAGTVISQDTIAGKTVYEGTEVGYVVSLGEEVILYKHTMEIPLIPDDRVVSGSLYLYQGDINSFISTDSLREYLNANDGNPAGYFDETVTLIDKWLYIDESDFPYVVSVSDQSEPSGTLICVWEMYTDEGEPLYEFSKTNVEFTRQ